MTSHASELARDEAARVEAEFNETPEPSEPQPEPEPGEPTPEPQPEPDGPQAPGEGLTEAKAEAIFKSLERWQASNAREVEKRAGPMFQDLVPCPCCVGAGPVPGFIFAQLPEPEQSMRRMAVVQALGGEPEAQLLEDPDTEACERCGALGKLQTGSKVMNQDTRVCTACNGQGWKLKAQTWSAPPVASPQAQPQAYAAQPQPIAPPGYTLVPNPPQVFPQVPANGAV